MSTESSSNPLGIIIILGTVWNTVYYLFTASNEEIELMQYALKSSFLCGGFFVLAGAIAVRKLPKEKQSKAIKPYGVLGGIAMIVAIFVAVWIKT